MVLLVNLTIADVRTRVADYIAISADVSEWREAEFLSDLPDKWSLSFALLDPHPIAYCIMSTKFGQPHIHQFMVATNKRGSGIGGIMLREAVRRGAKTLKVDRANEGAIRFYKRHGWRVDRDAGQYIWLTFDI